MPQISFTKNHRERAIDDVMLQCRKITEENDSNEESYMECKVCESYSGSEVEDRTTTLTTIEISKEKVTFMKIALNNQGAITVVR